MKTYDVDGVPYPARIRIVLKEKGIEDQVEYVRVGLIDAEQKSGAFVAKNPIGKLLPNISIIRMAIQGRHEWGKRRGAFAVQYLPYFDKELETRPFIAGDTFSMADITLFVSLVFCDIASLPIAPNLTTLAAWRARVSQISPSRTAVVGTFSPATSPASQAEHASPRPERRRDEGEPPAPHIYWNPS